MGVQCTSLPGHHADGNFGTPQAQTLEILNLSPEVVRKLTELQQKGIDINQLLLEFLGRRENEITEEKNIIAAKIEKLEEVASLAELYGVPRDIAVNTSRYIPRLTRNLLKKEFGTKCAVPTCNKKAQEIHHANRFSMSISHNPLFLAPLCTDHHKIAHSIDIKFNEVRSQRMN